MNSYVKVLTPMLMAVLVGSLTFIFAQSERGDVGKSPTSANREIGAPALPGGEFVRGFPPGFAENLDLTDQQKAEIETLREKSQTDGKEYFEKVKSADWKLKQTTGGGNFDETQARQIIDEKLQAFAELEIIHLRCDAAIREVLSDEQKIKLDEIKSSRPEPPTGGGKFGVPPLLPPPEIVNRF